MNSTTTSYCQFCRTPINGQHYARAGEVYCCEGCFLKQQEFHVAIDSLEQAQRALAEAVVSALDVREHETGLHSKRVACHTLLLARRLTDNREELREVYRGALLHDIGKIGIPDAILRKTSSLSEDEWTVMRTHPDLGYAILKEVPRMERGGGRDRACARRVLRRQRVSAGTREHGDSLGCTAVRCD